MLIPGSVLSTHLFVPKLAYCLPVWCSIGKTDITAFDHVIERCARIILRNKSAKLDADTYHATGLLPFSCLSSLKCLTLTNRLLSSENPLDYLPPLMSNDRITRNVSGRKFFLPHHKSSSTTNCFNYMAAKCWNDIPHTITQILDYKLFNA